MGDFLVEVREIESNGRVRELGTMRLLQVPNVGDPISVDGVMYDVERCAWEMVTRPPPGHMRCWLNVTRGHVASKAVVLEARDKDYWKERAFAAEAALDRLQPGVDDDDDDDDAD